MKSSHNHGGPRPGAGRKPGSGKGRTVKSSSITLPLEMWRVIDSKRGNENRSQFIRRALSAAI